MWCNHNRPGTTTIEDTERMVEYWCDKYLSQDEYLVINGRPVIYIFSAYRLKDDLGMDGGAYAVRRIKELIQKAGYGEPYMPVVAAPNELSKESLHAFMNMGFDAITA